MIPDKEWIDVADAAAIRENDAICISTRGHAIAIFRVEGALYAISNVCPHAGGRLDQGYVDCGRVVCPWHGWSFPLALDTALNDGVIRYPVRTHNGRVLIAIPEASRPLPQHDP